MNSCKCFKSFFYFVLWHKMDNDMLRLLIVFFLGMFCKLQNMRWTRNITSIICCRGACSAWSKLVKPLDNLWHPRALLLSKISAHKNDISQLTQLTYIPILLLLLIGFLKYQKQQMFFKIGVLKNVPSKAFSSEFY